MAKPVRVCVCGCQQELSGRQIKYAAESCKKVGTRDAWLRKVYGITLEDFKTILAFQGGVCAICKRKPRVGESFVVDHLHDGSQSGPVRGVLCNYCNVRILGRLKSAEKARNMANYLDHPPATSALGREVIAPGRPRAPRRRRRRT